MKKRYLILKFQNQERRVRITHVKRLIVTSVPMGLQFSITAIGSIILQSAVNVLGSVYVSAFTSASKIQDLAWCPFGAFATASSTFGSQNLGAGQFKRIHQGLMCSILIAFIYAIIIGAVLVFAGSKITLLYVDASETAVLKYAQQMLTFAGLCFWLMAFLDCTRMTIQGLGHSAIAVFAGCGELAARGFMAIVVIPKLGYDAGCCANPFAWAIATAVVIPIFFIIVRRMERSAVSVTCSD